MELWQTIVAAVAAQSIVLAVLGWLAQTVIVNVMKRDSQKFENDLKAQADHTLEQVRADLQLRLREHDVRFSRLHEKRAEVLGTLNTLVIEALWEAQDFLSPIQFAGTDSPKAKALRAERKVVDLYRFAELHRIYLPPALSLEVRSLVDEIRPAVIMFQTYLTWDEDTMSDDLRRQKLEQWTASSKVVEERAPAIRERLEQQMRELLAPST